MAGIKLENIRKEYQRGVAVIDNLNLEIENGSFTVLLGASGCGKSTVLRMIAGLEKESAGNIYIDDKDMKDVEPGDRNIAMVFQNYALYPTMSVRENISFGLKNIGEKKDIIAAKINAVARIVGLSEYLDRKPQNLSGGQRQRVALARAIVKQPKVFLMDEPLSNLDAKLRTQIRSELIELYRKLYTTFVYVTHDQVEAMSMATKIILLDEGKIQQIGTPTEIYEKPNNVFTAKFIGSPPMNVIGVDDIAKIKSVAPPNAAFVGFRPESVTIQQKDATDIEINVNIIVVELLGDQNLYKCEMKNLSLINCKTFGEINLDYGKNNFYISVDKLHYFDINEKRI